MSYLPVERAIERYWAGVPLEADNLAAMQARAERVLHMHDHYRFHNGLSLLYYLQGIAPSGSLYERTQALEKALFHARQSLQQAPLQPELWLRIADGSGRLFRPRAEVVAAYKTAIYMARVEPTHLMARVQLGLALQYALDPEGTGLLRDQLLLAWNLRHGDMIRSLNAGTISMERIRPLLAATHPDLLAKIEADLASRGR